MNYLSMAFYFAASGLLVAFAFTNKTGFLIAGVVSLAVAVVLGKLAKKKQIQLERRLHGRLFSFAQKKKASSNALISYLCSLTSTFTLWFIGSRSYVILEKSS